MVSKVGLMWDGTSAIAVLDADSVRRRVDASLARLGVDRLDIVLAHMPDPGREIDEVTAAMAELVAAGKVRAYGWSNFPLEDVVASHYEARLTGATLPSAVQCQYSMLERSAEDGLFASAARLGYETSVWGPLTSGWLTAAALASGSPSTTASRAQSRPRTFDPDLPGNRERLSVVRRIAEVAADAGQPIQRLALAFVLAHPDVSRVIIGPTSQEQLDDYVAAARLDVPVEIWEQIDTIVPPGSTVNRDDIAWRRPELTTIRTR